MKQTLLLILLASTLFINAQESDKKDKLSLDYFSFMEGEWTGVGYYSNQKGGVDTVYQHEAVVFKLKRNLLTIEGTGRNKAGELIFNAFATIYHDFPSNSFKMMAFKDDGNKTQADIKVIGPGHFIWSFSPNPYANIKYELKITETGSWTEIGYFSADKENWSEFFSMELEKQ